MISADDSLRSASAEVCIYFGGENRKKAKILGIKMKAMVCKKKTTLCQCPELSEGVCEQELGLRCTALSSRRAHISF